jgi:hypothetical protein
MARTKTPRGQWLDRLPATFIHADARELGISDWALTRLRREHLLEQPSRGIYAKTDLDAFDHELLAIATRAPAATLCLRSALARHDLIDDIPSRIDIALPVGTRPPALHLPISWHRFAAATFDIGRQELELPPGPSIGIYSPERCIIDAFRLRRLEGPELGNEALRRWLRKHGSNPGQLIRLAAGFPRAEKPLRNALEILR